MFVPIIHKNTVLPNRKSDAFATSYDGQDAVEITVYQGEDPDALNNVGYAITNSLYQINHIFLIFTRYLFEQTFRFGN
jgi:molecular chaperone DnaK (HSP70)